MSQYAPRKRADYAAVENLTREAFWNVYSPGCSEHYIVHRGARRRRVHPGAEPGAGARWPHCRPHSLFQVPHRTRRRRQYALPHLRPRQHRPGLSAARPGQAPGRPLTGARRRYGIRLSVHRGETLPSTASAALSWPAARVYANPGSPRERFQTTSCCGSCAAARSTARQGALSSPTCTMSARAK